MYATRWFRCVIILLTVIASLSLIEPGRAQSSPKVTALRTEYKTNPLGIDTRKPRLSWQLQSATRGTMQAAYQIRVARNDRDLLAGNGLLWDSGRVNSDESIHRVYDGPPLKSGERYFWQVRAWDSSGKASEWSDPATWEMGLLDVSDWKAIWIEPDVKEGP